MKVFCLGNEYFENDSYAIKLCRTLKSSPFNPIECQSADTFLEEVKGEKKICIIDVVKGIDDVKLLKQNDIRTNNLKTAHDFDIGFFMSLLKEMGELAEITIIGIPQREPDNDIINKVKSKLKKFKGKY